MSCRPDSGPLFCRIMSKARSNTSTLPQQAEAFARCELCRLSGQTVVLGEGPPDARIMLIGQNPGVQEDQAGRPFVGRAGRYLDEVLKRYGLDRKRLFITSVVKCRTPHNRKPSRREIEDCMPLLVEQIRSIRPGKVVLMGEVAWKTPRLAGIEYIETYHPAAAMRFPRIRAKFEADMARLGEADD